MTGLDSPIAKYQDGNELATRADSWFVAGVFGAAVLFWVLVGILILAAVR